MIAKIGKGRDFAGLFRYLYGPGKQTKSGRVVETHFNPHIVATNLPDLREPPRDPSQRCGYDVSGMVQLMREVAEQNHRVDYRVWHTSLSAAPEDCAAGRMLSDEEWQRVAEDYMRGMGLYGNADRGHDVPWVAIRHDDGREKTHIHIVASRVRYDGRVIDARNDRYRSMAVCREIERRYGLADASAEDRQVSRLSTVTRTEREIFAERREAIRQRVEADRLVVADRVRVALVRAGGSMERFVEELEAAGVLVEATRTRAGVQNGLKFGLAGAVDVDGRQRWYASHHLHRDLAWKKIAPQLGLDPDAWRLGPAPTQEETGKPAPVVDARRELAARVRAALEACGGEAEAFHAALAEAGVAWRVNLASTGRVSGYAFALTEEGGENAVWWPGSKLGRDLAWSRLAPRLRGVAEAARAERERKVGKADVVLDELPVRERLAYLVRQAAAVAGDEETFFARLADEGLRVRRVERAGALVGYLVAVPGDRDERGRPVWYGADNLAPDLTWARIRDRWQQAPPGEDLPVPRPASRAAVWHQAAEAVGEAATAVEVAPAAEVAAVVESVRDLITVAATHSPAQVRRQLVAAARDYERAARGINGSGAASRHASQVRAVGRMLAELGRVATRTDGVGPAVAVIVALVAAAVAVQRWQQNRQRTQAAQAAADAAARLRAAAEQLAPGHAAGRVDPLGGVPAAEVARRHGGAMAAHARAVLGPVAEQVVGSERWPQITVDLYRAQRAGVDPRQVLATAKDQARRDGAHATVADAVAEHAAGARRRAEQAQRDAQLALVRAALPQYAEAIAADPAWPALAATLARARETGHDPARLLAAVAAQRELHTADSLAQVLTWRLQRRLAGQDGPEPGRTTPARAPVAQSEHLLRPLQPSGGPRRGPRR
ncbi:hypothetical protein LI90_4278 [Carbonactinospora thermoautotrophica]|uniref:MobA/VirD2-like nuclease domain-containing protein n=1 Tax=Carbonactinospora thermoautotrophica TaxID=1469144 RepID=A0A132MZJ1_9ACTN|nr:relaxase/mobilization nuclease domain-containing protein [Carbonactinospora thermoautotrophica]KWX03227.1 hypothetical protein LI90_4278 [Carbonactinospora thermoautotrophica]